jgi:hypothetical protein
MQRGIASCGMEMVEMMKMLTLRISMITAAGFVKLNSMLLSLLFLNGRCLFLFFSKHHGKFSEMKAF